MSFELSGRLIEKFDTRQISDSFKKREFVIETVETNGGVDIRNQVKFQLTQDRCALLDMVEKGNDLKISFNIRGRRWEKEDRVNYFTNLEAWRIEKLTEATPGDQAPSPGAEDLPPEEEDDLPF